MKRYLFFVIMGLPIFISAQNKQPVHEGIAFVEGISWNQVLKKAKKENKYIFVDCFATWCGPCKEMEKNVFTKKEVGDYFNEHFLSVRLQMDKTEKDNEQVKSWYETAASINKEYGIPAYPTLLFFSPEGKLTNRVTEYLPDQLLIEEGKNAHKPGNEAPFRVYYSWLTKFQQGKLEYDKMAGLSDTALQLGQNVIAEEVEKIYRPYLLGQDVSKWYEPANLWFMANFMKGSQDLFFSMFYKNRERIDSILNIKGFAEYTVDKIIQKEEILPVTKIIKGQKLPAFKLVSKNEPDWKGMYSVISAKYDSNYADRNILQAQILWYCEKNKYSDAAHFFTLYVERYPVIYIRNKPVSFFYVNSAAWDAIFMRSVDKRYIDAGIKCMGDMVKNMEADPYAGAIDTYANLLYKAGRRDEAIKYQQQAVAVDPNDSRKQIALDRMRQGKPTWPSYISNGFWDTGLIE